MSQHISHSSRGSADSRLQPIAADSGLSPILSSNPKPLWSTRPTGPTLQTSETSTDSKDGNLSMLTSLRQGCLASLHRISACGVERLTLDGSGHKPSESSGDFDPVSVSLRTRQRSLLSTEDGHSMELFQDWPRSGMICGGTLYPLAPLVQGIAAKGSSSLLPTPVASPDQSSREAREAREAKGQTVSSTTFHEILHRLPTPTCARDWKDSQGMKIDAGGGKVRDDQLPRRIFKDSTSPTHSGLKINPRWLCWFQGYPVDWLKPLTDALETQSSRRLRKSSSRKSGK